MNTDKAMNRYLRGAIAGGYYFECGCARLYKSEQAAKTCQFCREYRARGMGGAAVVRDIRVAEVAS